MPRPITDTLRQLRGGDFIDEASEALARIVTAVTNLGGTGKLVIELSVKKASRASGAVVVTDKVAEKLPTTGAAETLLFATPEGNLVTEDPRQTRLDLKRVVPENLQPPKAVAAD
jgi:hypothetical protein